MLNYRSKNTYIKIIAVQNQRKTDRLERKKGGYVAYKYLYIYMECLTIVDSLTNNHGKGNRI